jgi:hypothetical protein
MWWEFLKAGLTFSAHTSSTDMPQNRVSFFQDLNLQDSYFTIQNITVITNYHLGVTARRVNENNFFICD